MYADDSFENLVKATIAFYELFGIMPPQLSAARNKFTEECFEFHTEIGKLEFNHDDASKAKLLHEGVDVIVTVLGVLFSQGITLPQIEDAMDEVADKNAAKVPGKTHGVVNGAVMKFSQFDNTKWSSQDE